MTEVASMLLDTLGNRAHSPGSPGFVGSLGRVFFPDASRRHPLAVVTPASVADVITTLKIAGQSGVPVTVRGGGLSSNCVADDSIMIDLSVYMNGARREDDSVVVEGGATVGAMLRALASTDRTEPDRIVPVGIAEHAGFGLVTRGGVGYYTRSLGLTVDHLVEVQLITPDGEVLDLSDRSTGSDADLWWAVRGCAPPFGVVTSARLRTHRAGPMWVDRAVIGLDALSTYFRIAPDVPRHTMMGAVLGYSDLVPDEPVLFLYTTCASQDFADIDVSRSAAATVVAASADNHYRSEMTGRYLSGLPQYAPLGRGGTEPLPLSLPEPHDPRGSFFGKAVFTGPTLDASVAEKLVDRVAAMPTRSCRIDFQQTGGALADVGDSDTSFWGRGSEWNIPLNAIWDVPADGPACMEWASGTLDVLSDHTIGVYSVEVRPGFDDTDAELTAAFGGNLPRLRALREEHDPHGIFRTYPL